MSLSTEQKLFRHLFIRALRSGEWPQASHEHISPLPLRSNLGHTISGVLCETYLAYANEAGYRWARTEVNLGTLAWSDRFVSADDPSGTTWIVPGPVGQLFCGGDDGVLPYHLELWQKQGVEFDVAADWLTMSLDPRGLCLICHNSGIVADPCPNAGGDEFAEDDYAYCGCPIGEIERDLDAKLAQAAHVDPAAQIARFRAIETMVDPTETLANLTELKEDK